MKNEKIKEFLTKIAQEEGFKVEFLKLKEKVEKKGFSKKDNEKFISECLLPWSKKLGYKLSKKDFIDFDRTQKPTEITGLSPAELENVSGGAWPMLLALFAIFGGAFAGGGGTTGNNAKTNDNFGSTDLTFSYSSSAPSSSGDVGLASYKQTGIDSIDYYNSNYGKTPLAFDGDDSGDFPHNGPLDTSSNSSGNLYGAVSYSYQIDSAGKSMSTTPGQPQTLVNDYKEHFTRSSAAVDSGENVVQMLKDIHVEANGGTAAGDPMSTALVTTPGQPQTSVKDYNENFARSSAEVDSGENVVQMLNDSHGTAEGPGSADTTTPTAPKGPTGIASYDNYLVGEGKLPSNDGHTPVDLEGAHDDSVGGALPGAEFPDKLNPFGLNQNMFSASATPLITQPISQERSPGLFERAGNYFKSAQDRRRELDTDRQTNFDGFEGTPEEIAQHNYENYGETSAKEYDKHYARTSPGDYDQNYARSSRPAAHTFNMVDLSSKNGVHTETLGAPLGVPSEVSDALDAYPQTGGTSQQTRLAGNVSQYGENIGASSPIPLGAPEGLDISATSSALGGQETINMLKDIHAAENANFKATETQTNQDSAGKSISTALVTTPGQPQPSVDDYNKRFARFSAAVDSGENVVQMLKDIHVEANDGSAVGYALSTAPETTPVQHEILQQTESAGSTIELLGLEGENSTSSGPVSGVTSGGIRWHLNTKGETVFDRDISSAQTTTTTTTGGSNSGPGTTTTSASTPSSTGSPSVGLLGYSQSSAGSGSVVSEQAQPGVPAPDFNITTGFAGGGTPAEAPLPGQINTTQGNSTFSATQNNTTSNTTSESFTSSSSQNGQSWKDIVKGTAQMTGIAAGLGAAALGTVYTAASVASALSGDGAQQTANKTKGTSKKTEDKKSTKETKKDGSDFMRSFMETLQKNSPEASQYLDSLK